MKIISTLARFIKFGKIEIAPNDNILTDEEYASLKEHKGFAHYVKSKHFEIQEDEVKETLITADDYIKLEDKTVVSVKNLKAICKELEITGYSKLKEAELIALIDAELEG